MVKTRALLCFLETTPAFFTYKMQSEENIKEKRSFRFLFGYVKKYRKYFGQIILGLVVGSLLHLSCHSLPNLSLMLASKTKTLVLFGLYCWDS